MSLVRRSALRVASVLLAALLGWAPVGAQQPSKMLAGLQETARDYFQAKDYRESLAFYERALPLVIAEFGAQHEQTGIAYYSLGLVAEAAGDLAKAERYYRQSLDVREIVYGRDSAGVAVAVEHLGQVLMKAGRIDEAEPLFRRALKIRQDLVGSAHAFSASGHANLGHLALARGRWQDAQASYREAIRLLTTQDTTTAVVKALVDDEITRFRDTFIGLSRASWQIRQAASQSGLQAFDETFVAGQQAWNTQAASALAKMTARLGAGDTELGRRIRGVQDLANRSIALNRQSLELLANWSLVQRAHPQFMAVQEEFRAASLARSREQAPVIRQQQELIKELETLIARCPSGARADGCAGADRRREAISQELGRLSDATRAGSTEIMAIHARMEAAERALPGYADFNAAHTRVRDEAQRADRDAREARLQILRAFPDYGALADPRPLARGDVESLLRPDEVLVTILVGSEKSFVWALTRERVDWAQIDLGAAALATEVAALRLGLDPLAQQDAEGADGSKAGVVGSFDLARAHRLYRAVFGPVAGLLAGKTHLIVVPSGALTSLPLQVLVTEEPKAGLEPAEALRSAKWLIASHAMSVLPSVPSLAALRRAIATPAAQRPFFGMGDPVLEGPDPADRQRNRRRGTAPARFYRNGLADIRAVRELTPLPDTADELRAIAAALNAGPDAVALREQASETRLKQMQLDGFRILQFATHGLVAGDLTGLAEPALVLTPPDVATDLDDGLLTASEIAALKLNADWVVLSACNTAAGGSEGAEALSGLARAFFYAGARTLLVSHWSVYSTAATELTTATFETLAAQPRLGRAEAFRQSILRLIAEGRPPAYWAPFVVVGEGGPIRR